MNTPIKSSIPGIHWPGLPAPDAARQLALQLQFEHSQWWPPQRMLQEQLRQLRALLAHAATTVPYYRDRFAAAGIDVACIATPDDFVRLPILTRAAIQEADASLRSRAMPREHGPLNEVQTSGSTGRPIKTVGTAVTRLLWRAFTLREHLWQQRDFSATLAAIRTEGNELGSEGAVLPGWGPATDDCLVTGPSMLLGLRTPVDAQARWLVRHDPGYLLSHPSNLRALARHFQEHDLRLPRLRQVRSFGETLAQEVRDACRAAWHAEVVDVYSAQEAGYLALQCPRHAHYHVQSEGVYLEVLDAAGRACAPGQIGRVVITTLHNFAAPLIRYEIGDYAEVGDYCDCGRGLPVLTRILGRQRNMLTLPDGRQLWPSFPAQQWTQIAPIRQLQLVQQDLQTLDVRVVPAAAFTAEQEANLRAFFQQRFGYPFNVTITCLDAIERAPNSKFEDFVSKVSPLRC